MSKVKKGVIMTKIDWSWLKHLVSRRVFVVIVALTFVFVGFIVSYAVNNIYLTYGVMVGGIVVLVAMFLDRDAKIKLGRIEMGTGGENKKK